MNVDRLLSMSFEAFKTKTHAISNKDKHDLEVFSLTSKLRNSPSTRKYLTFTDWFFPPPSKEKFLQSVLFEFERARRNKLVFQIRAVFDFDVLLSTGPVLFPPSAPGSETSGVVVGASGFGFVPGAPRGGTFDLDWYWTISGRGTHTQQALWPGLGVIILGVELIDGSRII